MSTGAVLSQPMQRRQQSQLGRQAALEIVGGHGPGSITTAPTVSDTHGHDHLRCGGGSVCQRAPWSHNSAIAVSSASSVGSVPSTLLNCTQLDHPHSPHLSATHGHEHLTLKERVSTGAALSQVRQRRQQPKLSRQAALETVVAHVPGVHHHSPHRQRHMDGHENLK